MKEGRGLKLTLPPQEKLSSKSPALLGLMTNICIMHFLLVFFYHENLYLPYLHMNLFLSLCIYHNHNRQIHHQNFLPTKVLIFSHILVYFLIAYYQ